MPSFGHKADRTHGTPPELRSPPGTQQMDAPRAGHPEIMRATLVSSLVAQAFGFIGAMLLFTAACSWPADLSDLGSLHNTIYVLQAFSKDLTFSDPKAPVNTVATGLSTFPYPAQMIAAVLVVVGGVFAIIKRRWLFAGLAAAFLLFPWGLFGIYLPMAPFALTLFAIVGFLFHAPVSRRVIIAVAVLATLASPLIVGLVSDVSRHFGVRNSYSDYRVINYDDLVANEGRPPSDLDANHKQIIRTSTLKNSGIAKGAPEAYALAQEETLRGNAEQAATALAIVLASNFPQNAFDQKRLQAIHDYVAISGALGPEAHDRLLNETSERSQRAILLSVFGVLLLAGVPLTNALSWRLARRGKRVDKLEEELQRHRSSSIQNDKTARRSTFGLVASAIRLRPASLAEGERAIGEIEGRLRFYFFAAVTLLGLAIVLALCAYRIWLPDPASNTAFQTVSLVSAIAEMAKKTGAHFTFSSDDPTITSMLISWGSTGLCIAAVVIATRRSRLLGAVAAIAAAIYVGLAHIAISPHSRYEIALNEIPSDLIDRLRSEVEAQARRSGNIIELANGLRGGISALKAGPATDEKPADFGSAAAYTLAQIAYLEGRASEASVYLNDIERIDAFRPDVHRERLALLVGWVSANGYPVANDKWFAGDDAVRSLIRSAGRWLICGSLISLALAILVVPLFAIASTRRSRIEALIEERQRLLTSEGNRLL